MRTCLIWFWVSTLFISGCSGERIITKAVTEEMAVVWAEYTGSYSTFSVSPEIWSFGHAGYGTDSLGASVGGLVFTKKTFPQQYVSIFQSPKRGELVSQCEDVYRAAKVRTMGDTVVVRLREKYLLSCVDDRCVGGKKMKLLGVSVVAVL